MGGVKSPRPQGWRSREGSSRTSCHCRVRSYWAQLPGMQLPCARRFQSSFALGGCLAHWRSGPCWLLPYTPDTVPRLAGVSSSL